MKTFEQKMKVLQQASFGDATFEVLEIGPLEGASHPQMAEKLYFTQQAGLTLKQVKITLNNSKIKTEAGALYLYKGHIESETKIGGAGGAFKKMISGALTDESLAAPAYYGTGEVWLEPSFKHYFLLTLEGESIIVDKGLFFACSDKIQISAVMQQNVSSALLGGEGLFQMKLSGHGVVVLECDVPNSEIMTFDISNGEVLKVDGNFAIIRTEGVQFSVTRSDKSLLKSAMNGEGLLNTFTGTGRVFLAPTAPIYRKLEWGVPLQNNNNMNNIQ